MRLNWRIFAVLALALLSSLTANFVQRDLLNSQAKGEEAKTSGLKLEIEQGKQRIALRERTIAALRFKMDSSGQFHLQNQGLAKAKIEALNRRLKNISLDHASSGDLDSLITGLYGISPR